MEGSNVLLGYSAKQLDLIIKKISEGTLSIDSFNTMENAIQYILLWVEQQDAHDIT